MEEVFNKILWEFSLAEMAYEELDNISARMAVSDLRERVEEIISEYKSK